MKNALLAIFVLGLSCACYSQESLNTRPDFLPNEVDSNNFYMYLGGSFIFPFNQTTSFQKKTLVNDHQRGNRVFQGKMEMLLFPSMKYTNRFEPHVFFRAQAFPMQYVSTSFGGGISDRKLSSSFGVFVGQYYRNVPYESNFITRRRRNFEYYPLHGLYLQSSSEDASFFFSLAKERKRHFHSVRVASRLGRTLSLGQRDGIPRTIEVSFVSESFTGNGLGLSLSPVKGLRVEVLLVDPNDAEQVEQARVRYKLSPGVVLRLEYCVN